MDDREKIIKGIQECDLNGGLIGNCPYKGILLLLKEQEAVPVIQREFAHLLFWGCGSCGAAITHGDKYCRMCGKVVKWDER